MRKGLADIKIVLYCSVPLVIGAMAGSIVAIYMRTNMGAATGDAILRLLLGVVLLFVAILFIAGGAKLEYPQVKHVDWFTSRLGLKGAYWEESLQKQINYQLTRALVGGILFLLVGFMGGFFGLGGGWAAVPVLNIIMSAPIKISAACSGVLLAIGNATAIWPYIIWGSMIALFAGPWLLGQVVGGIIGAHLLVRVRASFVRYFLIAFLFLSCIKLISRGIEGLFGIEIPVI